MEFLNTLIDQHNFPLLSAFILGVMTSISPCPLATNITAIAYISKEIKTARYRESHRLYAFGNAYLSRAFHLSDRQYFSRLGRQNFGNSFDSDCSCYVRCDQNKFRFKK